MVIKEYERLYADGPAEVGLILLITKKGRTQEPIQLEGILESETGSCLVFSELSSNNLKFPKDSNIGLVDFKGGYSYVKKSSIAVIYKKEID